MALPCCANVEISRVSNLSKEAFNINYLSKGLPVIILGETDQWPAKNWSLDSLCDIVGDNVVAVRANTSCDEYKLGRKYNIRETTFRKYVEDLKAGNKRSQSSYLAVQNIRKALPQLQDDIRVPEYVGKLHGGPFLWIAHKGHYEYCHVDPDDGFLVMLQGTKEIRLFGCDMDNMYPNQLGSKGRTVQSQVDCNNPDISQFPLFSNVTCYHCTLQPGEMLFIPAFWWHQVTSTEVCISVNMFWGDAGINTYITKIMNDCRWPAFRRWLLNIVEQNRQYTSFTKTLSRLPESLYNFLVTQWHEEASNEQMDILVREILSYLDLKDLPNEKSSGKHPPPLQIRGLLWRS